jgi:hypothetical protein
MNNNVADANVPSGRQSLQSSLEREADAFAAVRIVQQQVASSESSQINVPQPQADKEAVPALDVDRLFRKAVRAAEELDGIATIEPSEESVFSARSVSSADGDDDDGSDDDDDEDLCSVQQPVIAASAVAPPDLPPPPLPPLLNRAAFDRVLESATGTDRASLEAKIEAIDVELRALRKLGNEQRRAMYAASGLPLTTGARRVALGLFCLLLLFLGARRSGYAFANATRRVTVDKELLFADSQIAKTFADVSTLEEAWQWIRGPLLDGVFGDDDGFGRPPTWTNATFVFGTNVLLGGVRLRLVRVQRDECGAVPAAVQPLFVNGGRFDCWPAHSVAREAHDTFGVGAEFVWRAVGAAPFAGRVSSYSGDGYLAFLRAASHGFDVGTLRAYVDSLQRRQWSDRAARALFVDYALVSGSSGQVISNTALFEVPPDGGVLPFSRSVVIERLEATTADDRVDLACYVVLSLLIAFKTVSMTRAIVRESVKFYRSRASRAASRRRSERGSFEFRQLLSLTRNQAQLRGQQTESWLGRAQVLAATAVRLYVPWIFQSRLFWFELLYVVLAWSMLGWRVYLALGYAALMRDVEQRMVVLVDPQPDLARFVDASGTADAQRTFNLLFASLAVVAWPLFALHVAAANASLFQVTVVARAIRKFIDFAFLFFGVVVGFSQALHVAFQDSIFGFGTYWRALISTFQALLGSYDYDATQTVEPALAPYFFVALAVFGSMFMFNLIISFLGTAIADAEQVLEEQREWRRAFDVTARRERRLLEYSDGLIDRRDELERQQERRTTDRNSDFDD